MTSTSWGDRVATKLKVRLERSQAKIDQVIHRPEPLRREPTKDLLVEYMASPEEFETPKPGKVFVGRERLMEYVKETYGDHARFILPYLQAEETDDQGLPLVDPALGGQIA